MSRIEGPAHDRPRRTAVIDVDHGTSEQHWRRAALERLAPFDLDAVERAVIVAPHPDDEVLALGVTMRRLAMAGTPLTLLAVTDGESSHPGSSVLRADELARRRPLESAEACDRLGITFEKIVRCARRDGAVESDEPALAETIAELLDPTTTCFVPFVADGHPDHEAAARAGVTAAGRTGAPAVQYPVWAWHWSVPGDGVLPLPRARIVSMNTDEQRRKAWAIDAFTTQTQPVGDGADDGPILPRDVLAHFLRPFECVLVQ